MAVLALFRGLSNGKWAPVFFAHKNAKKSKIMCTSNIGATVAKLPIQPGFVKFEHMSALELAQAIMAVNEGSRPIDQLLDVCDSAFSLLLDDPTIELPDHTKKSLVQLEKWFRLYAQLLQDSPTQNS